MTRRAGAVRDVPNAFATQLRVRYAETDQMGVVYHAHYLVWCEVARVELIRSLGLSYAQMERDGIVLAVADANIRYHGSARYDDVITVRSWLSAVQSRAITFEYRIERKGEDAARDAETALVASASTVLIALDKTGTVLRIPRQIVETLRAAIP